MARWLGFQETTDARSNRGSERQNSAPGLKFVQPSLSLGEQQAGKPRTVLICTTTQATEDRDRGVHVCRVHQVSRAINQQETSLSNGKLFANMI